MILFKFDNQNPDTETMRQVADSVSVLFDASAIAYHQQGVGYRDAPDDLDATPLQDAFEQAIGERPTLYSPQEYDFSDS